MSVELAALITSFRGLNDITRAAIGLHDAIKLNEKIIEFQQAMIEAGSHVMAVQQEYSSMTADVQKLKEENVRLKDWSAEKAKYEVRQIADGVFACVEKSFMGNLESAQKLCCNCFNQQFPSLLQQSKGKPDHGGRLVLLTCPKCRMQFEFNGYKTLPAA